MKTISRCAIVGAGAIGVLYATLIQKKKGTDALFFIADEERSAKYKTHGFLVKGKPSFFACLPPHAAAGTAAPDLIIFATKFYGLKAAIEEARPFAGPDTIFMSFLNGVSSEELIKDEFGDQNLLYSLVKGMDATKLGNTLTFSNTGTVVFSSENSIINENVQAVAAFFDECCINYENPVDIKKELYNKLMLNCGVNQVCALHASPYSAIHPGGAHRTLMREVMEEVAAVVSKEGIQFGKTDIDSWFALVDTLSPEGYPSMAQDVLSGRPMEIGLFSGTIRNLGKKHGMPTPLADMLYEKLTEIQETGRHEKKL